jgi:hypothetical protein
MSEITLNKGEWSEVYTFIKLLAEGKLYAADSELKKLENEFYPLIKVITQEIEEKMEYVESEEIERKIKIVSVSENKTILEIPANEFLEESKHLLEEIKKSKGASFSVPRTQSFTNKIKHLKLKSNSDSKRDITIVVHDLRTGREPELGFSIKSKLGGEATLFNASGSTNFIYEIKNFDREKIEEINSIEDKQGKLIKRVKRIMELGGNFKFKEVSNEIFNANLSIIDSNLPRIVSNLLFYCYSESQTILSELLKIIELRNPEGYNLSINPNFYDYKIKKMLSDIALGMKPAKIWTGTFDATGGYIVVREDGELLCYHIYNMNEFQEYLLKNTKLETPSTSRHDFGKLYEENGKIYFKLNLQIRFI